MRIYTSRKAKKPNFIKYLKYAKKQFAEIIVNTENPKFPLVFKIELGNNGRYDYKFYGRKSV